MHPTVPDLSFLYGTIFTGKPHKAGHHSRNVCVFAEGEVDRSPTGTGVAARCALQVLGGDIPMNQPMVIESILGTTFEVQAVRRVRVGDREAIIPEVTGSASITGRAEFEFEQDDPLIDGFILR